MLNLLSVIREWESKVTWFSQRGEVWKPTHPVWNHLSQAKKLLDSGVQMMVADNMVMIQPINHHPVEIASFIVKLNADSTSQRTEGGKVWIKLFWSEATCNREGFKV